MKTAMANTNPCQPSCHRIGLSFRVSASHVAGQLPVRPRALAIDLFRRRAKTVEDVLDEREGDLSLARIDAYWRRRPSTRHVAQILARAQARGRQDSSSRAVRMTSALFAMPAEPRTRLPAFATPAASSVSGRVASP